MWFIRYLFSSLPQSYCVTSSASVTKMNKHLFGLQDCGLVIRLSSSGLFFWSRMGSYTCLWSDVCWSSIDDCSTCLLPQSKLAQECSVGSSRNSSTEVEIGKCFLEVLLESADRSAEFLLKSQLKGLSEFFCM